MSLVRANQALNLVVVYHSNYGHTRKVAHAIQQGASVLVCARCVDIMDLPKKPELWENRPRGYVGVG